MGRERNASITGIGNTTASYDDGFPCDACKDGSLDGGAWECACTLVPAYDCGTDGAASLCVCARLATDDGVRDYVDVGDGTSAADMPDDASLVVNANEAIVAADSNNDHRHIRSGMVRLRLRDPRIGLVSSIERPLYVSEDGSHIAADEVVHEILQTIVPDDKDDVIAWASRFGSVSARQTLQRYGDWWRRHGAADAIRAAVGNDARFDIDCSYTNCFPMGAHAIVYSGMGAFDVWARLDGHACVTVANG